MTKSKPTCGACGKEIAPDGYGVCDDCASGLDGLEKMTHEELVAEVTSLRIDLEHAGEKIASLEAQLAYAINGPGVGSEELP